MAWGSEGRYVRSGCVVATACQRLTYCLVLVSYA